MTSVTQKHTSPSDHITSCFPDTGKLAGAVFTHILQSRQGYKKITNISVKK